MHTFDQVLLELFNAGRIDQDTALANADSRTDLSLRMREVLGLRPALTPRERSGPRVADNRHSVGASLARRCRASAGAVPGRTRR